MPSWVKGLLSGVTGAVITFLTAYLAYISDNNVDSFAEITGVTWSVMGAGALIQLFMSWKLLLTEKPK